MRPGAEDRVRYLTVQGESGLGGRGRRSLLVARWNSPSWAPPSAVPNIDASLGRIPNMRRRGDV